MYLSEETIILSRGYYTAAASSSHQLWIPDNLWRVTKLSDFLLAFDKNISQPKIRFQSLKADSYSHFREGVTG